MSPVAALFQIVQDERIAGGELANVYVISFFVVIVARLAAQHPS